MHRVPHPACHPHSHLLKAGERSFHPTQKPREGPLFSCYCRHGPLQRWVPEPQGALRGGSLSDCGQGRNPSELATMSPHSPRKPSFRASERHCSPFLDQHCCPQINPSLLPSPPSDPAFSTKGSEGLTPTQAIMMNNGLMWVFTGDSNAALMEGFQALTRVRGGERLSPHSSPQAQFSLVQQLNSTELGQVWAGG